ncbi:hypothetical protein K491DRAFT_682932 [Lophiostoma macrostomum CBS 122681]|uniref:Uncharacterized protein n=1 Tax=Lophiostoma macrostomum CBS 122681 TaxID=1314788 RepID=A0A6A6SVR0_9PLEO|nr:hypothetical protein K491DRAFT_682932 [Lophiostoma macrostomum CBS 122681]
MAHPDPSSPPKLGRCVFFSLPPELRNSVYEFTFTEASGLVYGSDKVTSRSKFFATADQQKTGHEANQLKFVCRQLYCETVCLELGYNDITFPVIWDLHEDIGNSSGFSKHIPFEKKGIILSDNSDSDRSQLRTSKGHTKIRSGHTNFLRFLEGCAGSQQARLRKVVLHEPGKFTCPTIYPMNHWKHVATGQKQYTEVYDFCNTHPTSNVVVHYDLFEPACDLGSEPFVWTVALHSHFRGLTDASTPLLPGDGAFMRARENFLRHIFGRVLAGNSKPYLDNLRMSILLQAPADAPIPEQLEISREQAVERINYMQKWYEQGF